MTSLQHDISTLTSRIEELEAQNARLSVSTWFHCLTRPAVDERLRTIDPIGKAIVYLDIDGLTAANNRWGKIESSRRIRESLSTRYHDMFIGQYFSGDEFVAVMDMRDARGYAERTQAELSARGMSATFVIVACHDRSPLTEQIDYAETLTAAQKAHGNRASITVLPV